MELQDVEQHMGINTSVCENVCKLLKCMVTASSASARGGLGNHMCSLKVIFLSIYNLFNINTSLLVNGMRNL